MASQHHDETDGVVFSHPTEEPEELDADEPRTPGWMPLLGGVLFLGAAIFFVATQPPGKTTEELQRAAQAAPPAPPDPAPVPDRVAGAAEPRKGG